MTTNSDTTTDTFLGWGATRWNALIVDTIDARRHDAWSRLIVRADAIYRPGHTTYPRSGTRAAKQTWLKRHGYAVRPVTVTPGHGGAP